MISTIAIAALILTVLGGFSSPAQIKPARIQLQRIPAMRAPQECTRTHRAARTALPAAAVMGAEVAANDGSSKQSAQRHARRG